MRLRGMASTWVTRSRQGGLAQGDVAKEATDGGEAGIAGADGVSARVFGVIEESQDGGGVEIREPHRRGLEVFDVVEKVEEAAERISVGGDGLGANALVLQQMVGEEPRSSAITSLA